MVEYRKQKKETLPDGNALGQRLKKKESNLILFLVRFKISAPTKNEMRWVMPISSEN